MRVHVDNSFWCSFGHTVSRCCAACNPADVLHLFPVSSCPDGSDLCVLCDTFDNAVCRCQALQVTASASKTEMLDLDHVYTLAGPDLHV